MQARRQPQRISGRLSLVGRSKQAERFEFHRIGFKHAKYKKGRRTWQHERK